MVHTVTTFITSPSWTSCGRYIELSLILEVLEDLLISVDRLDVLKGNLILQCNRYSTIDYQKLTRLNLQHLNVFCEHQTEVDSKVVVVVYSHG